MKVELGDTIMSADGENVGVVRHVILDPETNQLQTLAVEKGWLIPNDYEVPFDSVDRRDDHTVWLNLTAESVRSLPRFDEARYISLPGDSTAPLAYPPGIALWPIMPGSPGPIGAYSVPPYPLVPEETPNTIESDAELREEQAKAVLAKGAEVFSSDGEKVGVVDNITFDSSSGRPESLLIRRGFIFSHDIELGGDAIRSVDDGVVYLNVPKETLERMYNDDTVLIS